MGFSSKRGWLEESEVGSFLSSKGYNALKSIAMVTFSLSEQRVDLFFALQVSGGKSCESVVWSEDWAAESPLCFCQSTVHCRLSALLCR